MIYILRTVAIFASLSFNAFAQENTECGEYVLRGILRIDKTAPFSMIYIVNEETKSKYRFTIQNREDSSTLAMMINVPTTINVKILKPLEGYSGVIKLTSEISRRFLDPMNTKVSSMEKIKSLKCENYD